MSNDLSLRSSAALYGKAIFTTIAIRDDVPFLLEKHWRRLSADAETLGIDLTLHSESFVVDALAESIKEDQIINGRARITFFDERPSAIWLGESISSTSLSIITGGVRDVPDNFKLTVSPYPINSLSPLAGVKSCNYLENLMAAEEAKMCGFHEAIRVNERNEVTSAAMANVFWLKNGELFTPSLATGCLAGTTREFVLENLDCREVESGIEELNSADAIYLTSAGLGIVAVAEFEKRKLPNPPHQITRLLTNNY